MIRFIPLALLLTGSILTQATAQHRVDMPELGVSVEVPAEWDARTYKVTDNLPETGLYHVTDANTGDFISIRRDGCASRQARLEWVNGDIARRHAREGDEFTRIDADEPVRFEDFTGFLYLAPREDVTNKGYAFYGERGGNCYAVTAMTTEDRFPQNLGLLRFLLDNIAFSE